MASLTIASHRSSEAGRVARWACRSRGITTVGPVTTRIAPSTEAVGQESPATKWAARAVRPQTKGPPKRISRRTAFDVSRISATLSVSPPSKRMIATAIDTTGR